MYWPSLPTIGVVRICELVILYELNPSLASVTESTHLRPKQHKKNFYLYVRPKVYCLLVLRCLACKNHLYKYKSSYMRTAAKHMHVASRLACKGVTRSCLFMTIVLTALGGCVDSASSSDDKEAIMLKIADTYPTGHPFSKAGAAVFMEEVEKASQGRIHFNHFPSGQMGKAQDLPNLTRSGVVDIASVAPPMFLSNFRFLVLPTYQV